MLMAVDDASQVDDERQPYGVPLDEFLAAFPAVPTDQVDVEMDRCPGAVPRIVVWLLPGEGRLVLPARWRGYQVEQRPPLRAILFGAVGETMTPPQVDGKVGGDAQKAAFPVGVVAVIFGVVIAGFVVSFFIRRSPTGRWTWKVG